MSHFDPPRALGKAPRPDRRKDSAPASHRKWPMDSEQESSFDPPRVLGQAPHSDRLVDSAPASHREWPMDSELASNFATRIRRC